jgi:(p)ppGpp synthase/HD superfamily hydrolase
MIKRAIELAAKAHHNQFRKGTDTPYFAHPCNVGVILAQNGCPVEVIAAGILHDVIEDTPITVDDLRLQFGKKVASIVEKCSEPDKSLSWTERKQHTIDFLAKASMEVKFVACADKLDNIISIARDYDELGEDFWKRFNASKEEQSWYYHGLVKSLSKGKFAKSDLFRYFKEKVDDVFNLSTLSNLIDAPNLAKIKKLGYRLVIEDGMYFLFKDGDFPVLVTDSPVNVADWMIEHT